MNNTVLGRVMVLGSRGMVGAALIRQLQKTSDVLDVIPVGRDQVDLTDQNNTFAFMASKKPDWVIVAAAKVGGIHANNAFPKDFIYQNLAIELNAIEGAYRAGVEKLIFLGSSCIYPRSSEQPIREQSLLTGLLEPTNEPYAIAKIAGIKLCESFNRQFGTDYRSLMPTNLYGIGDNYHSENSHVIPGLIRRFHDAKLKGVDAVAVWGNGTARREFLYVDDLADAVIHVMRLPLQVINEITTPMCSHLNVGSGIDVTIADLARLIKSVVGLDADLTFDPSRPDGAPRKLLDISRLSATSWKAKTSLEEGLIKAYEAFRG